MNSSIPNASRPPVAVTLDELWGAVSAVRGAGQSIGLVPTMGALHAGHFSLVQASRARCDFTLVTIFVNPLQFGPSEDLERYPRTVENDLDALAGEGADLVFVPTPSAMYPPGFSTRVTPPAVAQSLEGAARPGHFQGVATVVLKLFLLTAADVAFFGQKDFQQALVVRRMVADLNVPIRIEVCPVVREPDGLAMSSRNRFLDPDERRRALALWAGLQHAERRIRAGERDADLLRREVAEVLSANGADTIEYAELADPETLVPQTVITLPVVILVAVRIGSTRLIDNLVVGSVL